MVTKTRISMKARTSKSKLLQTSRSQKKIDHSVVLFWQVCQTSLDKLGNLQHYFQIVCLWTRGSQDWLSLRTFSNCLLAFWLCWEGWCIGEMAQRSASSHLTLPHLKKRTQSFWDKQFACWLGWVVDVVLVLLVLLVLLVILVLLVVAIVLLVIVLLIIFVYCFVAGFVDGFLMMFGCDGFFCVVVGIIWLSFLLFGCCCCGCLVAGCGRRLVFAVDVAIASHGCLVFFHLDCGSWCCGGLFFWWLSLNAPGKSKHLGTMGSLDAETFRVLHDARHLRHMIHLLIAVFGLVQICPCVTCVSAHVFVVSVRQKRVHPRLGQLVHLACLSLQGRQQHHNRCKWCPACTLRLHSEWIPLSCNPCSSKRARWCAVKARTWPLIGQSQSLHLCIDKADISKQAECWFAPWGTLEINDTITPTNQTVEISEVTFFLCGDSQGTNDALRASDAGKETVGTCLQSVGCAYLLLWDGWRYVLCILKEQYAYLGMWWMSWWLGCCLSMLPPGQRPA